MKLSESIKQHYDAVRKSSSELLQLCRSLIGDRVDILHNHGIWQGALLAMCAFSAARGVVLAHHAESWRAGVNQLLLAGLLVPTQWLLVRSVELLKKHIAEAVDRHVEYSVDSKLLDLRMYTCSMLSATQEQNKVIFVSADGTRYLAKEMVEEIVHMTPDGLEYLKSALMFGIMQQGEYKYVDLSIFDKSGTDEAAEALSRPDPLSN